MPLVPRCFLACALGFLAVFSGKTTVAQASLPSLSEPAISPDGKEIAFASGGDIWTVAAIGGEARLLVTNPATESRPLYSPDGTRLAIISTRTWVLASAFSAEPGSTGARPADCSRHQ